MNVDELILSTDHLTKKFGRITAVDNLSLEVHRGEIFGFLGPNGAGKTTTIGMLLGLIKPTSGRIEVFGLEAQNNWSAILPRVSAVMETAGFYPYLSGRDNLRLFSQVDGSVDKAKIEQLLQLVWLLPRADDKFKTYSQGMKQRLSIARALLNAPEVIFLDEPTRGMDPMGMKDIRELIIRLGEEGKTIFLSSHLLYEVEQVCDHVAIVKQGKVLAQGGVSEFLKRGEKLRLRVTDIDVML
jgi:ABC-2 type transport system ATP-binding protein